MADYLFIETREPFTSKDVADHYELAARLQQRGSKVSIFLTENAVLALRPDTTDATISGLLKNGVEVFADSFALAERAIASRGLDPQIQATSPDIVVELLAQGRKALWH